MEQSFLEQNLCVCAADSDYTEQDKQVILLGKNTNDDYRTYSIP